MHATKPLFPLGRCVLTPGAARALAGNDARGVELLTRHMHGDYGCIDPEDAETNDIALLHGLRIMSAYPIDPRRPCKGYGANCLWVVTEPDHSVTTISLPEED